MHLEHIGDGEVGPVNLATPALLFTDLDGTLLDHATYLPGRAAEAVRSLIDQGVVVVMATSKTAAETHHHAVDLGIPHRAIVENGAAIIWDGVEAASFGAAYHEVRQHLDSAALETDVSVRGYGDMTADELSHLTGLSPCSGGTGQAEEMVGDLHHGAGRRCPTRATGRCAQRPPNAIDEGRAVPHRHGDHDKVSGVPLAVELSGSAKSLTFGVGDAGNDLGFLGMVSHPMVVQRPDGTWLDAPGAVPLSGIGPDGFVLAARRVLEIAGRAVEKGGSSATR